MTASDSKLFQSLLAILNLACVVILAWLVITTDQARMAANNDFAPRLMAPCVMDQDGYLHGQLYGAIERPLDWNGSAMLCDGMPRPEGRGIRLVFAEQANPDLQGLVIVIGLADALLGESSGELTANVTVIDQQQQQLYSTQEDPRCWVRLTHQQRLHGTNSETWRLDGELYCASALAALTGPASLTLGDLEFSGVMKPAVAQ